MAKVKDIHHKVTSGNMINKLALPLLFGIILFFEPGNIIVASCKMEEKLVFFYRMWPTNLYGP